MGTVVQTGETEMTNEQNEIITTIEKMLEMVKSGELPLDMCPISNFRTVYYCALCYANDIKLAEQIAEEYCTVLQSLAANGARTEFCMMLELMIKSMKYEYEKRSYYEKQNKILADKLEEMQNGTSVFDEILQCYEKNGINEKFLEDHTYQSLVSVKEKGSIELFKEISAKVYETALNCIRKKQVKKIVFLLKDSAEWSCEELYKRFNETSGYEVCVAVAPFFAGSQQAVSKMYLDTVQYFRERKIDTVEMYDIQKNRYKSWEEIGMPDIVFHLNPHYKAFAESSNICNFPLSILNVYIPYGIMIYGNVRQQYNQLSHMLYWKIFCETPLHKEMASKYADIGDINVVCSGYVKMDTFFDTCLQEKRKIWKISPRADEKKIKKIIYAPHWSIKDAVTGFGNFDKIYKLLYEYVKKNETSTSWVFRPHPMLRVGAVQQGIFKSEEEYEEYLEMWRQLPNAQVIENGMYTDIFESSDAMILDSISFLGEYIYMHKPMLFLTRDRNTFNDFGKELVRVLYKTDGGNLEGIKNFVEKNVIGNEDPMKERREEFFEKYMDYRNQNGMLASEYIKQYIDCLTEGDKE